MLSRTGVSIPGAIKPMGLSEAAFWRPEQARFLREELLEDADWAELIDTLDASLRHPGPLPGSTYVPTP